MVATIGVLALQGAFTRHQATLERLGCQTVAVRYPRDLERLDGLVIPGGESGTISRQLDSSGLRQPIITFAGEKPVLGTCAGLIIMSRETAGSQVQGLDLLDLDVVRNGWGRQAHSFTFSLPVTLNGHSEDLPAIFIRAPRITRVGQGVEVLAAIDGEPVLVRQGRHLGATFHPELTADTRIHQLFLRAVEE
ncbi:MAG: pyridoxal 5'-phosphate synthase glutaminase subunit PdxT [Candidatus Marinimicrobia bacterium]|nr:pyridoxal 5'-phosphate synthase glutaminase subunit PdxT [Candidatus Neomarinimicrobiota bacterium]